MYRSIILFKDTVVCPSWLYWLECIYATKMTQVRDLFLPKFYNDTIFIFKGQSVIHFMSIASYGKCKLEKKYLKIFTYN